MSDTPRTDANKFRAREFTKSQFVVSAEYCAEIERDLAKSISEISKLERQVEFFRKGIILRNSELKTLRKKK